MKPDTYVTLGDFTFSGYEVPEKIPIGGEQMLSIKKRIGGKKVIDSMGPDDAPMQWSGRFQGQGALARALTLNRMRRAGKALVLTWSQLRFSVVIKSFIAEYERDYQILYTIVCEVVSDDTQPLAPPSSPGVDSMVASDMSTASAQGDQIADAKLTGLLGNLDSAISQVSSFATATQAQINSVLAPIAAVQSRVTTLIGTAGNTIANVTTLGGILPANPIALNAGALTNQVAAMTQLPILYNLQSVTGRMSKNITEIGVSGQVVPMAGGDLYRAAADAYGNSDGWTTIAKANSLTDPELVGAQDILIPPSMQDTGGVLV